MTDWWKNRIEAQKQIHALQIIWFSRKGMKQFNGERKKIFQQVTLESLKSHKGKKRWASTPTSYLCTNINSKGKRPKWKAKLSEEHEGEYFCALKVSNSFLDKSQKATTKEKKLTHQTSLKLETSVHLLMDRLFSYYENQVGNQRHKERIEDGLVSRIFKELIQLNN